MRALLLAALIASPAMAEVAPRPVGPDLRHRESGSRVLMNAPATLAEHDLAPLREFIADPATSEIAINPDGGAWIEQHGA
ncbi:MAG: hypothetical protein CML43_00895, partial [Rhodobacteraceae bacterium]|nr:hypothetical protein [Paracoccaceae bacterium]